MLEWWATLTGANQIFFAIAFFFSALFVWQFIATILGLASAETDVEVAAADADLGEVDGAADAGDADFDAGEAGDADASISFKLLSFRSVIAFGMMFGWAGALYLYNGHELGSTLLYSMGWAFAGGLLVAVMLYLMRRMQESGTPRLATCVGQPGTVYMDIPAGGAGKVRTVVSGAVSFVAARGADGAGLKSGTPVRIRRMLDSSTVEVEAASNRKGDAP